MSIKFKSIYYMIVKKRLLRKKAFLSYPVERKKNDGVFMKA